MLLEKAIESAVIAKLAALNLAHAQIFGGWQSAPVGEVKTEASDALCIISVTAKPRSYGEYMAPTCEVGVDIEISLRDELTPNGAAVADYCEPIFNLIQTWQRSVAAVKTDVAIDGFTVAGARADGGDTSHDFNSSRSVITQSVTIKGVIHN